MTRNGNSPASTIHCVGFPRIGAKRELKFALERYWDGRHSAEDLRQAAAQVRAANWQHQAQSGVELIATGDFTLYDHILDITIALGNIPQRHRTADNPLDTAFLIARGRAPSGKPAAASEMTKWFNTNYHYIVPEITPQTKFSPQAADASRLIEEISHAHALGHRTKPVIVGPCTYLWLAKQRDGAAGSRVDHLPDLISAYGALLRQIKDAGVEWLQIDEPILSLDLEPEWRQALKTAYADLDRAGLKIMLATYFGPLDDNADLALSLGADALHIDAPNTPAHELERIAAAVDAAGTILSVGIIDGRSVWAADLAAHARTLKPLRNRLGSRLWLSSSCSLQFVPVDLQLEQAMDPQIKSWLAFAVQKLHELNTINRALQDDPAAQADAAARTDLLRARSESARAHNPQVRRAVEAITPDMARRAAPHQQRYPLQRAALGLEQYPTTTVGSFPQTPEIRRSRREFKQGAITEQHYKDRMRQEISTAINKQHEYGVDLLVHGEAERNDMVEYFGEQLRGYTSTAFGWVQSYGSRCVKPPIIVGDISRPNPMTLEWTTYAQSLTDKPIKAILTGPTTMMAWAFVRDDLPHDQVKLQIALALRQEVQDLESAGIKVIQMDEPAIREAVPLRRADQPAYFDNAVQSFLISTAAVQSATQIQTHMCYADFSQIITHVAALDADVLLIEGTRSNMGLLSAFKDFKYPNQIGVGVFDIHSPNTPTADEMHSVLKEAAAYVPPAQLWVTPDCGLKTRRWEEVDPALTSMVGAAHKARAAA